MASKMNNNPGQPDKATPSPTQYFSLRFVLNVIKIQNPDLDLVWPCRWNNHSVNLVTRFTGLYQSETLTDVTLAAEGKHLQAHKMLLSACSDYFQSLFSVNPCQHPIVILKDVNFEDLQVVVQFMYNGIVNVSSEKLPDILKVSKATSVARPLIKTAFNLYRRQKRYKSKAWPKSSPNRSRVPDAHY